MQAQPKGAGEPRALTVTEQEAREECRVLREVLSIYPESMTLEELTRELTSGSPELSDKDAVHVAVLELVGCGLLHRQGDLVLPTRPAVVFHALAEDGEI